MGLCVLAACAVKALDSLTLSKVWTFPLLCLQRAPGNGMWKTKIVHPHFSTVTRKEVGCGVSSVLWLFASASAYLERAQLASGGGRSVKGRGLGKGTALTLFTSPGSQELRVPGKGTRSPLIKTSHRKPQLSFHMTCGDPVYTASPH